MPEALALLGAAGGVLGGIGEVQSAEAEAEANREALNLERQVKQNIGKGIEESLTALDIAEAKSRGDITDAQASSISTLSQERERLGTQFQPFELAGQRGVEQARFLTGAGTPEERAQLATQFGPIEESPLARFRREQLEQSLSRQQRAAGRVFSGGGIEQFGRLANQLSAEEAERQFGRATQLAQLGLGATQTAGGLSSALAQNIAGQQARAGQSLADITQQTAGRGASLRTLPSLPPPGGGAPAIGGTAPGGLARGQQGGAQDRFGFGFGGFSPLAGQFASGGNVRPLAFSGAKPLVASGAKPLIFSLFG